MLIFFSYYWYNAERSNSLAKDFFGEDMPDLDVLAQNTSLQLINTHFSINNVRPLVPNVIEVAGLHIQEPKPVNEVKLFTNLNSFLFLYQIIKCSKYLLSDQSITKTLKSCKNIKYRRIYSVYIVQYREKRTTHSNI